jgi:hypothetical protein
LDIAIMHQVTGSTLMDAAWSWPGVTALLMLLCYQVSRDRVPLQNSANALFSASPQATWMLGNA